jgi:predicted TPR repeat methyltransferase
MATQDTFDEIAPYYDVIMEQVDYDRWDMTTRALATVLPQLFVHLDAACGTGKLIKRLRKTGWNSVGLDLSLSMLRAGRRTDTPPPFAAADLRRLPVFRNIDYVTCLFDSMNFLLTLDDVRESLSQMAAALSADGLLYFDIITERNVTEYFAGQRWTEDNDHFSTSWKSDYSHTRSVAETEIRVSRGPRCTLRERVYPQQAIEEAVDDTGLHLLATVDAETWREPGKKTNRIDFIASKNLSRDLKKRIRKVCAEVRAQLR